MIKVRQMQMALKEKYNLCIGERTASQLAKELGALLNKKVRVQGRSYEAGRKRIVQISLSDFLGSKI